MPRRSAHAAGGRRGGADAEIHTGSAQWEEYAANASAVARQRLQLGGARLAMILNSLEAATKQPQPQQPQPQQPRRERSSFAALS